MSIPDRPQTGLPHQRDGRAPAEPAAYPADANTPPPREPRLKRLPGTFGDAGDNEPLPSFLRSRDDSASNVTAFPKIPQPQPDD